MADKPTYMSEVLAGRATRSDFDWWVSAWHDGESGVELHDFLGFTWDEFVLTSGNSKNLDAVLEAHGWKSPDVVDTKLFRILHDVSADHQQSDFQNATLSTIDDMAISISIEAPKGLDYRNTKVVNDLLRATFRRLVDVGCIVEIRLGPDDADTDEAKKVEAILALRGEARD